MRSATSALPAPVRGYLQAQFPVVDGLKLRSCIVLTKHRDSVDGERRETDGGEAIAQHRQNGLAPPGVKPARQGHVEAEVLHDVRIAPALKVRALLRRQGRRISAH